MAKLTPTGGLGGGVEPDLLAIMEENAAALDKLFRDWADEEADFLSLLRDTAARLDAELAELLSHAV